MGRERKKTSEIKKQEIKIAGENCVSSGAA